MQHNNGCYCPLELKFHSRQSGRKLFCNSRFTLVLLYYFWSRDQFEKKKKRDWLLKTNTFIVIPVIQCLHLQCDTHS